jgi:5-hydroxyisourate hydrolase-like protein (transthyretin family)
MHIFRPLFMMGAVLLGATSVHAGIARPGDAVIQGYVIDAQTRKPIAGVMIQVQGIRSQQNKEAATDSTGYFRMTDINVDEFNVEFEKKGYKIVRREKMQVKENMIFRLAIELQLKENPENEVYEHPLLRFD